MPTINIGRFVHKTARVYVSNTYNIANTYTDRLILVISSLQKVGFDAEITISAQLHVTHQINLQPDTQ
jgi:hypothetical protein